MPVRLKIKIEVDDAGIVKFKDLEGHADTLNKRLKSVSDTAKLLKITLGAVVGIFATRKVYRFAQDMILLNSEFDRAKKMFAQAADNVGKFTAETHKSNLVLAQYYQDLASYHRLILIDGMKVLTSFDEISNEVLPRAVRAMVNYAAFTGVSMFSAAKAVGKATEGMLGDLRRVGVQVRSSTYQLKGFVGILEELEAQMAGQAEMLGRSYLGQWKQLGNVIKDVKIELGGILNLVLVNTGALEKYTQGFKWLRDVFSEVTAFDVENWIKIGGAAALSVIGLIVKGAIIVWDITKELIKGLKEGFQNLTEDIKDLVGELEFLGKTLKGMWNWNTKLGGALGMLPVSDIVPTTWPQLINYGAPSSMEQTIGPGAPYPMTEADAKAAELKKGISDWWENVDKTTKESLEKLEKWLKEFSIDTSIYARDLSILTATLDQHINALGQGLPLGRFSPFGPGLGVPYTKLQTPKEILGGFGGLRIPEPPKIEVKEVGDLWERAVKDITTDIKKGWASLIARGKLDFDQMAEGMIYKFSSTLIEEYWNKEVQKGEFGWQGTWGQWGAAGLGAYGAGQAQTPQQGALIGGLAGLAVAPTGMGLLGTLLGGMGGGFLGMLGGGERGGEHPTLTAYKEQLQEIEQLTSQAIGNAFLASLETEKFQTFTQELKKGLYENIVDAFMEAFTNTALYEKGIGDIMTNVMHKIEYTVSREEAEELAIKAAGWAPSKQLAEITAIILAQHARGELTPEDVENIELYVAEQMEELGKTFEQLQPVWEAINKGLKDLNTSMGILDESLLEDIESNRDYINSIQDVIRSLRFGGTMPLDIAGVQTEYAQLAGAADTQEGLNTFLSFLQGQYLPIMEGYATDYPAIVEQVITFLQGLEEVKKTEIEDILNNIHASLGSEGDIVAQLKLMDLIPDVHYDAPDIQYMAPDISNIINVQAPTINITATGVDIGYDVVEGDAVVEVTPDAPPLPATEEEFYEQSPKSSFPKYGWPRGKTNIR